LGSGSERLLALDDKFHYWYGDQEAIKQIASRSDTKNFAYLPEAQFGCLPEYANKIERKPLILHFKGARKGGMKQAFDILTNNRKTENCDAHHLDNDLTIKNRKVNRINGINMNSYSTHNRKIYLSEAALSEHFWTQLDRLYQPYSDKKWLNRILRHSYEHYAKMSIRTGSISPETMQDLYRIANYFRAQNILEVGTYIGRSTQSFAYGSGSELKSLYTCDHSNDTWIPPTELSEKIHYFGKTSSRELIVKLASEDVKIDLLYLDGRISEDELRPLGNILQSDAVVVLDDFEGTEKGVENAFRLRALLKTSLLIRPFPTISNQRRCTALIVPTSMLAISRQQEFDGLIGETFD